MKQRQTFLLLLLVLAFMVLGAVAYWRTRTACVEPGPGLRGAEKRLPDGTSLYFNGDRWTTTTA